MKTEIALLALMIVAALMPVAAGASFGDWTSREEDGWLIREWVNPHRAVTTWNVSIELFPMNYTAEEDGGYTFAVYFRKSPKVLWIGHFEDFNEEHVRFARRVVEEWNASIRFVVEHYEWAKHLSKLRIKLYTDENVTQAPRINVLINANVKCPGAAACAYIGDPIIIIGDLSVLDHELGHALGLGHDYHGPRAYWSVDQRGFYIFGYPEPKDSFLLYALSTRWRALENSTAGSKLTHPGGILRYRDVAHIVGPIRSTPGYVNVDVYGVLAEGDVERPYPHPFIKKSGLGILDIVRNYLYGEDACVEGFSNHPLPFHRLFGNNTALVLYEADVQLSSIERFIRMTPPSFLNPYPGGVTYVVPLKFLTHELLREFRNRNQGREVFIWVIGGAGPATGNFSKIYGRGGDLCLGNLKDKVLVEARLGRAYTVTVEGLGPVEPVPLKGWSYRDYNGTSWVLRGSKVYLRPLNETFQEEGGVRYVWRGENITLEVYSPISGGELFRELFPKMWKKQYLIEVDSPYPFKGVGWFDEGTKARITPVDEVIDFGNGTKIVFKGFEGYNSTEITVDRPIKLKPVWKRMYRVDMVSRYVFSEEGKYFDEGESMFLVMDRAKDFGNDTRVELANMTAYGPSGEVVKAWDGKSGGDRYALLAYVVDRPLKLVVEWKVYHRLTVYSPLNSYEKWVLNGTTHVLDLHERKLVDSNTLMVLKLVRVNGEPQQGLEVTVTSPTSVEAIYQRKLRTTFAVDAGGGHIIEPEEVVLERGGEVEVYRPPFTYIGEGRWRVTKVTYLGGDIAVDANVEVNVAGMKIIPSRLRAVEVTVVDLLGVPVPYAMVRTRNAGDVTGILGATTLYAVPPWEFEIMVSHMLGTGQGVIRPQDTEVRIQAGISPYTLVILVLAASLAATVGVLKWRKRQ